MTPSQMFAIIALAWAPFALRHMIRAQRDPDQRAVAEHRRRMNLLAPEVDR